MNTYHTEGIPSEAIVFKDKNGKKHTYVIAEQTLRGELFDLNELIIPLNYELHDKIIYPNGEYCRVPFLNYSGDTIASYVPQGWQLLDSIDLDFNDDGIMDKVGVIEKDYSQNKRDFFAYPRILFALKGSDSGFTLDFEDINLVRHSREGGIFGDPYLPLTTDGKYFEMTAYGGSAWRWSERLRFIYDDGVWYLSEKESTFGHDTTLTTHFIDYYDQGYGIRKYNTSDFEKISSSDFELEFNIVLNGMESLSSFSDSWWLSDDRLGKLRLGNINYTKGITPLSLDKIKEILDKQISISGMTQDYIIFKATIEEIQKDYILKYYRSSGNVDVILEADRVDSFDYYDSVFEEVKLGTDGIYYVKNHFVENNEDYDVEKVTIHRIDLNGNDEVLATINNVPVNGVLPSFSINIISLGEEIVYRIYRLDSKQFYRLNSNDLRTEYIGEVAR